MQDNSAADMVFPTDPVRADSLKGAEDRLSNAIGKRVRCPFEALTGKGARRADAVRSRWRSTQAPATAVDRAAARGARRMAK
ncbi:hypothetical protein, partial [Burkholderia pseudomallei]|uniref:hypothetical protein n=1 Tax=Burkholderia pseudomallei TaxID=28450 RepID=UPI001AAFF561